jgi:hypothetical protein
VIKNSDNKKEAPFYVMGAIVLTGGAILVCIAINVLSILLG